MLRTNFQIQIMERRIINKVTAMINNIYKKNFFDILDKYLIADLNTMLVDVEDKPSGGLSYPAVQAIICGMELLGKIMSKGIKNKDKAFFYFWDEYFIKDNTQYDNKDLRKVFRFAVRNNISHLYLTPAKIQISKCGQGHLEKMTNGNLNIDAKFLFKDFMKTYQRLKDSLIKVDDSSLNEQFDIGYNKTVKGLGYASDTDKYLATLTVSEPFVTASGINNIMYPSNASTATFEDFTRFNEIYKD